MKNLYSDSKQAQNFKKSMTERKIFGVKSQMGGDNEQETL